MKKFPSLKSQLLILERNKFYLLDSSIQGEKSNRKSVLSAQGKMVKMRERDQNYRKHKTWVKMSL